MKLLLIFILSINLTYAQDAVSIKKGEIAQFDGILLTKERAEEAMKAEKSNIVLKDLRIAQEELTEYYRQDARIQRRKLSEAQFSGFMSNTLYFVVGVLVTGFAFKVNQKIGEM